jgi:hypothetical protein
MISLALALALAAEPAAGPKIAVLRLEGSGVPAETVESAASLVPTEVRKARPGAQVISHEDVRALLSHQKERVVLGCGTDAACMVELGGALGADEIVAGRLGRLGDTFVLEMRRVDVPRAVSLGSATRTVKRADAIVGAVVSATAELFGAAGAAPPEATAEALPAPAAPRLSFAASRPDDESLPRPELVAEELEFHAIRYPGTRHRAVYDLVRRILVDAKLPIDSEKTDDPASLRLRSKWMAIERGRRLRVRVRVDGHVGLDVDRERCDAMGCAETADVSRGELQLGREIHAALRGPVERGAF